MPEIERYSDSFDEFRDHPDSEFYAAANLSPEDTNREIVRSMDHVLHAVIALHRTGITIPLSTDALCDWHRGIFVSTFPDHAGRQRWKTDTGAWQMVTFGISIGTRDPQPVDRCAVAEHDVAAGQRDQF